MSWQTRGSRADLARRVAVGGGRGYFCHDALVRSSALVASEWEHSEDVTLRLEAGAVSELQGIVRFKFHEGKLEEFKRLSAQCMEIVRTEDTGTLQYDTYFNEDQSECIVLERFTDSEALIEHAANLSDLMEAILATGSVSGELLGEPSAELRAKIADSEVRLFTPFLSM
jgi:quinol monooxygenase YgiN